jgi:hypothetical protein
MAKSITAVSQERLKAIEEGGKAREYFQTLGFNVAELNKNSLSNIEIIRRMGESHDNAGKSAQTQAALIGILGEKAFKAAGAISKLSEQGPIKLINKEEIENIGRLADRLDELKRQSIVAAAPEVSFLETYTQNLTALLSAMERGGGLPDYLRDIQAAAIPALYMNTVGDKKFEALPLINNGKLGTVDSKVKRETSMFTEAAAPGWVNTMVGQIKIMTNETRAVRVNTGRTAQAVE